MQASTADQNDRPKTDRDRPSQTQSNSFRKHSEVLLDRPAPEKPPKIVAADTNIEINCHPPTRDKVVRAIKKTKNDKAARPHGIPAEALKTDVEQEEIPADWKDGHIIKLPKKGDLSS
jgi:hypothetical protein